MRTKLILSFVFVLVAAILVQNYLRTAKAFFGRFYNENFITATYEDIGATTGDWNTVSNIASLTLLEWYNMAETVPGPENISNNLGFGVSTSSATVLDSNNIPYVVWKDSSIGNTETYFKKWTPGTGWTGMDGITAFDNISNNANPTSVPQIALDSANNPYVVWQDGLGGSERAYFSKWTPGPVPLCPNPAGCWTKMDGVTLGNEMISSPGKIAYAPLIKINSANNPIIIWQEAVGSYMDILVTIWNPAVGWTKMDGVTLGFDNISNTVSSSIAPQAVLDSSGSPYVAWDDGQTGGGDIYFSKWTPGPGLCASPVGCWTKMDGVTLGYDNLSFPNANFAYEEFMIVLDTSNNPFVAWREGNYGTTDIYFSKWTPGIGWTNMNGTTLGAENISNSTSDGGNPKVILSSSNIPYISWNEVVPSLGYNLDLVVKKWTPGSALCADPSGCWTNMKGTSLNYELATVFTDKSVYMNDLHLNSAGQPYLLFTTSAMGVSEIGITRWNGQSWTKTNGIDEDKDPLTLEVDILSNTYSGGYYNSRMTINSEDQPLLAWTDQATGNNEIFFSKFIGYPLTTQTIKSLNVNPSADLVSGAQMTVSDVLNGQNIDYYLSNDGGASWDSVTSGIWHDFSSPGSDFRWRADLSTTSYIITPIITNLEISFQKQICTLDSVSLMSGNQQIIRATTSIPLTVWAIIEKNDVPLSTVPMSVTTPGNYVGTYVTSNLDIGIDDVAVFGSDGTTTYVCNPSTGADWINKATAPFLSRYGSQIVSFDEDGAGPEPEKLWLIGGAGFQDIWQSTDGKTWSCFMGTYTVPIDGFTCTHNTVPPWVQLWGHRVLVYNNQVYVMGGCSASSGYPSCPVINQKKDVWNSADMFNWTTNTNVFGAYRLGRSATVFDPDGAGPEPEKMWLIGGATDPGFTAQRIVLSSEDGASWFQYSAPRNLPASMARYNSSAITYDVGTGDKIYLMGGVGPGSVILNDVISFDASAWTTVDSVAPWSARHSLKLLKYDNKIWLLGGYDSVSYYNDVWWTQDNNTWTQITPSANWSGRSFFGATVFKNAMWLAGGETSGGLSNELWASSYDFTNLNFTVNAASPSGSSFLPPPSAPSNLTCQAIDLTENNTLIKAINWNFTDNATNEFGSSLYENETLIKEVATQDLTQIQEKDLLPNKLYTRNVRAYNGGGTSSASAPATCYTLANKPNKIEILEITTDSIKIRLDPNANPAETQYVIRVAAGTAINYLLPDGSLSLTEAWHTYAEFGGLDGIVVTGAPMINGNVNAASVQMSLTAGENYSFSVKAKNGDTPAVETAYSDINNSIPQAETGPNISATKGVAVNLAWNKALIFGRLVQAAGLFNTGSGENSIIEKFSFFLNFILLILLVVLIVNLFKTAQYLRQDNNCKKCLALIWILLTRETSKIFVEHAAKDPDGNYIISYDKHRRAHIWSRKTLLAAMSILILKLVILVTLIFGLIQVNHLGIAQTAPYDQNGTLLKEGDTLSYIVEVANNGTAIAQALKINDTLHGALTYESGSAKINLNGSDIPDGVTVSGNNLIFDLGDLDINESAYVVFKAKVNTGTTEKFVTNAATVTGANINTVTTNTISNEVEPLQELNENINEAPINENINQIPINENVNQAPINENINQVPSNENTNQAPVEPTESGTTETQIPIIGAAIQVFENSIDAIVQVFNDPIKTVFNNPQVEQSSQSVVTPIIITVAIANTLPSVIIMTTYLLPYMHLIFLEPLLVIFRKKRKQWGVVYNSLTKMPLDLALVRLYSKQNNMLVQTRVTDKQGRYIMIVAEPGKYYLTVTKPGFGSPTSYLKDEKQDTKYLDIYHGEEITVTQKNAVLTANIPLDPAEKKALPIGEVVRSYLLKNLRLIVSYVGVILALIVVLIIPTVLTVIVFIFHIILFFVFRHFMVPPKPKSWGIVYDEKTKEPLKNSVVRIFDTKFDKLLETQVTDAQGRYAFLVGSNEYQLLTEKPGYQNKSVRPVDLVNKQEIVNLDIGLQKL